MITSDKYLMIITSVIIIVSVSVFNQSSRLSFFNDRNRDNQECRMVSQYRSRLAINLDIW